MYSSIESRVIFHSQAIIRSRNKINTQIDAYLFDIPIFPFGLFIYFVPLTVFLFRREDKSNHVLEVENTGPDTYFSCLQKLWKGLL
jgi:hypothetical protein